MESRDEVSKYLKTFLVIFLGFFSYIWRYFDTTFRIQPLVYFVVIFLASLLAVFVIAAKMSFIWGSGCCRWVWNFVLVGGFRFHLRWVNLPV